ncbi:hypothetical protein D9757_005447 [Collybiopsis confluens]|uniref:Uncharacterized protein n=1 Tax=Collybiopsis confluens TaxID=2823264 RepID=A0A8H5HLL8_9AGAR|nr:hypothetical protein D9757_005447 [Collybiopsis confluens]
MNFEARPVVARGLVPAIARNGSFRFQTRPSIKDLVSSFLNQYAAAAGSNEKDESEVVSWIEKVSQGDVVKSEKLNDLNAVLVPKTYIAASYLTAADVALYAALHPVISKLQAPEYHSYPSVTRYFDHIQSIPPVRSIANASSSFSVVNLDLTNAPKIERAADAPKKKEKKDATTPEPTSSTPATSALPAANEGKGQKKEKKEKKEKPAIADTAKENKKEGKKAASGKSTPAPDEGEPVPSMIDLRVGHILDVQKHPDADGLYIEVARNYYDFSAVLNRSILLANRYWRGDWSTHCSVGTCALYPIEQMRDKYLVAVCNLKPANMRGVKSFAMVLCATSKEGKEGGIELIQLLQIPSLAIVYTLKVTNATPVSQLNPKKKIFETVQPGFITLESREAAWVDPTTKSVHKIRTKEGVCVAPTLYAMRRDVGNKVQANGFYEWEVLGQGNLPISAE